MNRVPDKDVDDTDQPAGEPVGKVEFDSRGNSVWRWARDVLESTSVLLKRLDNKDLALEPTQKVPVMRASERSTKVPAKGAQKAAKPEAKAVKTQDSKASVRHPALVTERRREGGGGGGGFDPYNSR
jgi:hypothetical protein